MASFQDKISWERPIKGKKKKKSFQLVPTRPVIENSKKIVKKFKKLKTPLWLLFKPKKSWERPRKRENKKQIVPTSSYPTRNRKFQKNGKKIQKI